MPLMTPPKPDARTATQLEKRDKSLKEIITPITHPEESQRAHLEEVIDTEFLAANALLAHVEGSEWTTNYYSQVMTVQRPTPKHYRKMRFINNIV